MQESFPSIFLVRPERAAPKSQFPLRVRRPGGNILFATKDDVAPFLSELQKHGGVTHMFLDDRHHAVPRTAANAKQLKAVLTASDIEAKALEPLGVHVEAGRNLPRPPRAVRISRQAASLVRDPRCDRVSRRAALDRRRQAHQARPHRGRGCERSVEASALTNSSASLVTCGAPMME